MQLIPVVALDLDQPTFPGWRKFAITLIQEHVHEDYRIRTLAAAALIASALSAQAQATDPGVELAFMSRTMTVTLLNEGGKYVAIDLKHIPQGGTCRMDKDATIAREGTGAGPGTIRVRYAAGQVNPGLPALRTGARASS